MNICWHQVWCTPFMLTLQTDFGCHTICTWSQTADLALYSWLIPFSRMIGECYSSSDLQGWCNPTAEYCLLPKDLFLERYFRIKKYLPASLSDELLIVKTERTWSICFSWYCLILLFSHLEQRQHISLIWFGFYLCSYLQFWVIVS